MKQGFYIAAIGLAFISCTNYKMTKNEQKLINNGSADEPFPVLLITNEKDSLVLRKECRDVEWGSDMSDLHMLIKRMKTTMDTAGGIGIAAPQIGISRNIFLFVRLDKEDMPVQVAINPKIITHSEESFCFEGDGCLSIPNVSGTSRRYSWVEVEYQNESGELIREKLYGGSRGEDFTAVIFLHEFDHLRGILFTDKLCE